MLQQSANAPAGAVAASARLALLAAAAAAALLFVTNTAGQGRVIRITTAQAEQAAVEQTEWAVGVIESRLSAQLAAEVAGRIARVLADEGQRVRAGQVLAEIETRRYELGQDADRAEVGRLAALIRNKEMELDRARRLVAERLIAAEQVDSIEADLDALQRQLDGARARVAESERQLGKTRITAPVDAEVAERLVNVGDFVQAGTVAFNIVDTRHLRVKLPFPEYRAPLLATGQKVRLSSVAAGSQPIEAAITEVRPSVNPANRSLTVIVDFDNPGGWRPGASVRAEVVLAVREDAVTVPQVAVVRRPVGDVVYVVKDGKAEERPVTRGLRTGSNVEIIEGLKPGEVVAVDGAGFLTHGSRVDIAGSSS